MARAISDEELQLRKRARRRLIGAVVVVTAVVVVLPMVLDREPKPVSQDVDIRIPAPDSGTFISKVAPVPESKPSPKPPVAAQPEAKPAPESKAPPTPESPATAKSTDKAAQAPETTGKAGSSQQAPRTSAGQFVIQVIALSDAQKAKQMQQQISAAGIESYVEVVKTVKGEVTRVRAGPFVTREAAEKAQRQLKGMGFDGKIAPDK